MGKEGVKEKVRTLFHPAGSASSSESGSILSLIKKAPKSPRKTADMAPSPYNGDQCFGSCCRGNGFSR
ncbi:hypothetical protein BJX76DRAFT_357351 [Aspergillus varians]